MATTSNSKKQQTTDMAIPNYQDDDFRSLESFDDALALLTGSGLTVEEASAVLGTGFAVLKDKGILVGVPFVVIQWETHNGDNGPFTAAHVMAKMPGSNTAMKYIVVDGSTGIHKQLSEYTAATGRNKGLLVQHGLTRSDYMYEDEKTGEKRPATTFYLDTSA